MSTNTAVRPGKLRDPAVGDIYENKHGSVYQLIYVDEQIALLRDKQTDDQGQNYHRVEERVTFNQQRDAGYFEYKPDSNLELQDTVEPDWTDVDHIGAKSATNLREAGFKTATDVLEADKGELKDVSGIGAKAVQNLQEFVR